MSITRSTIQTSVFALCIGMFSAYPAQAAEPELAFHPAQAWKVASGTGETCTLANNFNNGFELRMSGARGAVESLSIDFQQPAFEKDSSHEVTLSVPGGANATLQGRAASEQLLVVTLGNERDSFFNSMREAAVLDVATEGNEFRFYLTGFSDATARFDQCASGEAPTKAAAAAPQPTTIELPLEDLESDAEPVSKAEGTVEITEIVPPIPSPEIREEYQPSEPTAVEQDPMKRPVPPQHQRFTEKLQEEMSGKYKAPEPADYMKPYLEEGKTAKEGEEIRAVEKIVAKEAAAEKTPTDGDDMIAAAREAEEPAKPAPTKAPESISWNKTPPKTEHVKTPDTVVSRSTESMEVDLTGAHEPDARAPQPFEKKLERIEPASSDLSYRDETHREDIADMAQKISELEGTVHKLKTENAMLDSDLKSSLQSSTEERVAISSDNWNLERATMRYNEAERQIQRLGQQLQRERAECSTEKQDLEGLLFDPEVTSQQQIARLSELEGKLQQAESELDAQRRRYEEQIKLLEGRLNSN